MIRRAMKNFPIEDYDETPRETVVRLFPTTMLDGVRRIEAHIEAAFADVDTIDRSHCVTITLATWVHELDKAGRVDMPAPDVAYIYQAGRIAAEEVERRLHPRLQATIDGLKLA